MIPLTQTDLYLCLFHTRARGWMQFEHDMITVESEAVEHVRDELDLWVEEITAVRVFRCNSETPARDVTEDILLQVAEWLPDHPLTEKEAA